jgi:hypothetical protein
VEELSKFGISNLSSANWKESFDGKTADQVYDEATYGVWEILSQFTIHTIKSDYKNIAADDENNFRINKASTWEVKSLIANRPHSKYGRCYTYTPDKERKKFGFDYCQIEPNKANPFPLRVFLHAEDQFWDATNRQMGYLVVANEVSTSQV